jgi:hypothetical protein
MRILKSFLLISLILSKVVYCAFWQLNFYINQQEITALECENKDRPEMNCNGQCYLAKQLKKADEELASKKEKQEHSLSQIKVIEGSLFIPFETPKYELESVLLLSSKSFYTCNQTYQLEQSADFFHPPITIFNV